MKILFAKPGDEIELRKILIGYDMDIAGNVEEHVILKQGETVLAGGKLTEVERNLFHLEILGVQNELRGQGAGTILLTELLSHPWHYSNSDAEPEAKYTITTIARGEAAGFYSRCGFVPCSFSSLAWPYSQQCEECTERELCKPVPMVFQGGVKPCSMQ